MTTPLPTQATFDRHSPFLARVAKSGCCVIVRVQTDTLRRLTDIGQTELTNPGAPPGLPRMGIDPIQGPASATTLFGTRRLAKIG